MIFPHINYIITIGDIMKINSIIEKLRKDTNKTYDITYREKTINKKRIEIIYIESICNSSNISDFVIRSLDNISHKKTKNLLQTII